MQQTADTRGTKKPTNLSVNKELLTEARRLNINLSATFEQALAQKVRAEQRKQWLKHNREALDYCNELAERDGLFADKHRVF